MRLGNFLKSLRKSVASARPVWAACAVLAGLVALGGCETSGFIDPSEMMRSKSKERLLVPVLPSLAEGLDEAEAEFASAQDVKQDDLKASNADYVVGRNDLLSISITEVAGPGVESVKTTRVSESGNISLPLIGTVKAAGLTEAELERSVADAYRKGNLIQQAQVSVTVLEARQRTFSILGAVARPGQYQIVQSDFRLLDAMTLAGDVVIQGIEYAYIIRKETSPTGATTQPAGTTTAPVTPPVERRPPVDPLEGRQGRGSDLSGTRVASVIARPLHLSMLQDAAAGQPAQPAPGAGEGRRVLIDGKWVPVGGTAAGAQQPGPGQPAQPGVPSPSGTDTAQPATPPAPAPGAAGTAPIDTVAPVRPVPAPVPAIEPGTAGTSGAAGTSTGGFAFDAPRPDSDTRIIRVPLDRLQRGELQYNVVIRPNDTVIIPSPKVGEYYMGGHVQRSGVYSLTGRNITLKQAIISAGMLDQLAWPERTEVIRRVGKDREMFVRVNLPKIFAGEQSDIYLRPYDVVNVGTNALAPFLAAARGAFRITYGFGFIYDRNYAPQQAFQ